MDYRHLRARFYDHAKLNVDRSKHEKSRQYDDVVMVELSVKGTKGESNSIPATEEIKAAFPREWAEYNGERYVSDNQTLKVLGEKFTVARIKELESLGIYTVQDLANIADGNAMKMREGLTAKATARKYLEGIELAKREVTLEQVEDMQRRLAELEKLNEVLAANQKKTPGRKPMSDHVQDAQTAM